MIGFLKKAKRVIKRYLEGEKKEEVAKMAEIPQEENAENYSLEVVQKTGWSSEQSIAFLNNILEKYNISYKVCVRNELYAVAEEELDTVCKAVAKKEERKRLKIYYIQAIAEETGRPKKEVRLQMEDAKNRLGIRYKDYFEYKFYNVPVEDQEERYKELEKSIKKNKKAERLAKKKEKFIQTVMDNTGWDYETARDKMDAADDLCGAEYKDYVAYEFWKLDAETQKTYLTKGCANRMRAKYNTNKASINRFQNKNEFNESFAPYLGRPWACNDEMTFEVFQEIFKDEVKIIYKPLSASCGSGVTVFALDDSNREEVFEQLVSLPNGVVEGFLVQHHEMSKFSRKSVNTIRLVSVYAFGKVNLLYAAFRMGGGDSVVDNFHSGGVLALIDLTSGEVITEAIDLEGNLYSHHPVTNEKVLGFKVPHWDKVVQLIEEAATVVKGVGYVGWDIAITEDGPVLIEGNTAPAPNVLQLPYAKKQIGMRHVFEQFL